MRADVSDVLKVGDFVTIPEGLYAGLDGEVIEVVHVINPWAGRARLQLPCPHPGDYWHPFWSEAMDERQWLTTRDTSAMERFLTEDEPPWPYRKRALYACACVRRVWGLLPPYHRSIVEGIEAEAEAYDPSKSRRWQPVGEGYKGKPTARPKAAMEAAEALLGYIPQSRPVRRFPARFVLIRERAWLASPHHDEPDHQRALLRCVAGNPFRPAGIDPGLLSWQNETILSLALLIYEERRFDEMPVLADALEDAGCTNEPLLSHCRTPLHSRGCFLLDAILGIQ